MKPEECLLLEEIGNGYIWLKVSTFATLRVSSR